MNSDKTIIITGSSSGIGYHCAKRAKEDGFRVFATARKKEDVKRLKGEGFESLLLDLNDSDSIKNAIDEILELSDRGIYALFNNGAYGQPGAVEDLKRDVLKEQFETNLFGTHELTRRVIKVMREQGHGKIIQHSSLLGFVTLPFRGAYNASKYALEGLSDTLRLELYGSGIFISLIETGPVTSRFRKNALKKLEENIDMNDSYFKDKYKRKLEALKSEKKVPFELEPESVYIVLKKILEAKSPKPRYRVTKASSYLYFLKKILPTTQLDKILLKIG